MTPNDHYSGRTAPLTSKRYILYIYSTNIGTEYFKHGIYSLVFFSVQNAVYFIILTYLVSVLFTFYIQCVLKLKKNNNSGAKRLSLNYHSVQRYLLSSKTGNTGSGVNPIRVQERTPAHACPYTAQSAYVRQIKVSEVTLNFHQIELYVLV